MSFHYVDRILKIDPGRSICGVKLVTASERMIYSLPGGGHVLSPAAVTESLAQLLAWHQMARSDFTKRPVLLSDDSTTYEGIARVGDRIDLFVEILRDEDDIVESKSWAIANGQTLLRAHLGRGYMMPLDEFDDRKHMIRKFNRLIADRPIGTTPLPQNIKTNDQLSYVPGVRLESRRQFVDGVLEFSQHKKIVAYKNFTDTEEYFASHFPRRPLVPGVLLMTFVGETCQLLAQENMTDLKDDLLMIPIWVRNVRFRKFVEPGDQCVVEITCLSEEVWNDRNEVCLRANMYANGHRVMTGELGFMYFGVNSKFNLQEHLLLFGDKGAQIK